MEAPDLDRVIGLDLESTDGHLRDFLENQDPFLLYERSSFPGILEYQLNMHKNFLAANYSETIRAFELAKSLIDGRIVLSSHYNEMDIKSIGLIKLFKLGQEKTRLIIMPAFCYPGADEFDQSALDDCVSLLIWVVDNFIDWITEINQKPAISINQKNGSSKGQRKRGPNPETLPHVLEGLKYWLDDNKPISTAAELAGISKHTLQNRIPEALLLVDQDTRERWAAKLNAINKDHLIE